MHNDTFQRRHYEDIASIVAELGPKSGYALFSHAQVAKAFANALGYHNNNFNRDRFLRACGVED